MVKPDCIHISGSGVGGYRCDYQLQGSWDEKYMDDEVARLLPICENCLASYTEDRGLEAAEILQDRLLNPQNYLTEIPCGREPSEKFHLNPSHHKTLMMNLVVAFGSSRFDAS